MRAVPPPSSSWQHSASCALCSSELTSPHKRPLARAGTCSCWARLQRCCSISLVSISRTRARFTLPPLAFLGTCSSRKRAQQTSSPCVLPVSRTAMLLPCWYILLCSTGYGIQGECRHGAAQQSLSLSVPLLCESALGPSPDSTRCELVRMHTAFCSWLLAHGTLWAPGDVSSATTHEICPILQSASLPRVCPRYSMICTGVRMHAVHSRGTPAAVLLLMASSILLCTAAIARAQTDKLTECATGHTECHRVHEVPLRSH